MKRIGPTQTETIKRLFPVVAIPALDSGYEKYSNGNFFIAFSTKNDGQVSLMSLRGNTTNSA